MAFALIIAGIVLFLTAIKGTTGELGSLLASDTFGKGGYVYWAIAVLIIGAIGYIKDLKQLSNAFLVLVILVLFLTHKGFFAQFNQAIAQIGSHGSVASPTAPIPSSGGLG